MLGPAFGRPSDVIPGPGSAGQTLGLIPFRTDQKERAGAEREALGLSAVKRAINRLRPQQEQGRASF